MKSSMRAFLSLFSTNLFMVGGTGLLTTYLSLYVSQQQGSTSWVGVLSLCYYLGLIVGAKVAYHLISKVGHIRCFTASTAIVIACVSAHGVTDNLYIWSVLRLMVGIAMMSNYMVLESWLNEQAEHNQRGRVFSVYMITSYLGMVIGQFTLSYFPVVDVSIVFFICMVIAIAIVPISVTRRIHPRPLKPIKLRVFSYFKVVPQSLTAILFAGVISGSFYGLAPVYAGQSGLNPKDTAFFMAITVFAGLVAQYPMGLLSDRIHRSRLLRFNAVALFVISLLTVFLSLNTTLVFLYTFLFGLFAFTLYPLASALANSRVGDEDRVAVSSAILAVFGIGAGFGSFGIAQLMGLIGPESLYSAIAILTVFMFGLLSWINAYQKAEKPVTSDYVVSPSDVTMSPLAASMDPRIDEDTAQSQLTIVKEQDSRSGRE